MAYLMAEGVHKYYQTGPEKLHVLNGVSVAVDAGDFLVIQGRSGAGKSTLLHILGLLDRPNAGEIVVLGEHVSRMRGRELNRLRNRHFGFVFQFFHLLPDLSAVENVILPAMVAGRPGKKEHARAVEVLELVGLSSHAARRPNELSGGERQRVAIARAIFNRPEVLLCDEPTGNLDSHTAKSIIELLTAMNRNGQTVVMVTHDDAIADNAQRKIFIRDGKITDRDLRP